MRFLRMRRMLFVLASVIATAALAVPAALAVVPGTYDSTLDFTQVKSGAHFDNASGSTAPVCVVSADFSITCGDGTSGTLSYQIDGVGHTNATLVFTADYEASFTCTNGGRQLVEAQAQAAAAAGTPLKIPSNKNGSITVPSASISAPVHVGDTGSGQPCPNRNWTWEITSVTLLDYNYTLTFDGFSEPFISNSQTDP
jgi:hypothetical protein